MGYQINQNIILTGDMNSDLFTSHNNKLIDTMNLFNLTNGKSVSVTAIISNSSVKVLRKSNLFRAQRIFTGMLHIETELSLTLE
jgi:hypothetical protein